jgi:hypothetical protein
MTAKIVLLARLRRFEPLLGPSVAFFCFVFAALLLGYVLSPGDGYWQLHAELLNTGSRLYSDLGTNQQPLYFLISAASSVVFPHTILGQRIFVLAIVLGYVLFIYLACRSVTKSAYVSAALQMAVFFTAINPTFFRFDDYHTLTHAGVFASVYLTVRYIADRDGLRRYVASQVVIATIVFLTRINDALAIVATVGVVVLLKEGVSRVLLPLTAWSVALALTIVGLVLLLLGEGPAVWLNSTLIEASAAKGGSSLLHYPWTLLSKSLTFVGSPRMTSLPVLILPLAAGLGLSWRLRREPRAANLAVAVTGIYCIVVMRWGYHPDIFLTLSAFVVVGSTLAVALLGIGASWIRVRDGASRPIWWTLAFYPFFLSVFGSLSSGGEFGPLRTPSAVALLVLPMVFFERLGHSFRHGTRLAFVLLCAVLAAYGVWTKFHHPWTWWNYRVSPPGPSSNLRDNDRLGPHVISAELAEFIDPICARVKGGETLFSTPFSFANYYCGVPTWRGYIQTWFDLSTKAKIDRVLLDLHRQPPAFILYQHVEEALRHHEDLFNEGRPLPYRQLEAHIRDRVERGEWHIVHESRAFPDSHWLLIKTAPAPPTRPRTGSPEPT